MIDDSLDDVAKDDAMKTEKESMDEKRRLNKRYEGDRKSNAYEREVWNAAIEAAAEIVQPTPHINEERKCEDVAHKIRKLKK